MHFMSQPRYNQRNQRDVWYYRIKESFRDLTGRVFKIRLKSDAFFP